VEWLIQADDRVASRWLDRISFFLGTRWIPHGLWMGFSDGKQSPQGGGLLFGTSTDQGL
jgi:hypothetical protein